MTTALRVTAPPHPEPGSPSRSHLHALTGLRLVAALAVYFSHVSAPAGAPQWLLNLQQSGYAGVTFFFVLSGFVLALNYFDRLRTPEEIWRYTVARFARVYPLYLVVLAWPTAQHWAAGTLPEKMLVQHILGLQSWDPDGRVAFEFIGPAWSISVELFLYATLPLLVPLVRLLDRRVLTILGTAALVITVLAVLAYVFQASGRGALHYTDPASAHRWLYRSPLVRLGDFLLGILAARLFLRLREQWFGRRLGGWLVTLSIATTLLLATNSSMVASTWSLDVAYAVPGSALILGLALAPRHVVARGLALRGIVFLGEASFAFYLIHGFALVFTGAGAWRTGVTLPALAMEAMCLAVAMAIAVGLHVGVEKPARLAVTRFLIRPRPDGDLAERVPASGLPVHRGASEPLTERLVALPPAPRSGPPAGRPPVPAAVRRPAHRGPARTSTDAGPSGDSPRRHGFPAPRPQGPRSGLQHRDHVPTEGDVAGVRPAGERRRP